MTYRRPETGWAAAATAAARILGGTRAAAAACGSSADWLGKISNPCGDKTASVELALRLDLACAEAGAGTPIFDEYRRRLRLAGALAVADERPLAAGLRPLLAALRATADRMLQLLDAPAPAARGLAA